MEQQERFQIILETLKTEGRVNVTELVPECGVSGATLRSDIRKLDEQGLLKKVYGGAVPVATSATETVTGTMAVGAMVNTMPAPTTTLATETVTPTPAVPTANILATSAAAPAANTLTVNFQAGNYFVNPQAKRAIAEHAFTYIQPNDTIMLDDSTSCAYLAQVITEHPEKPLTIATNSLYDAALLAPYKHVRVYVGGGNITFNPPSVLDEIAAKTLSNYHVSKFFSGIHGIDLVAGLNAADMHHMNIKQQMMKCADQVFILATASKFEKKGLFTVCPVGKISRFITDSTLSPEIKEQIQYLHLPVDYVKV